MPSAITISCLDRLCVSYVIVIIIIIILTKIIFGKYPKYDNDIHTHEHKQVQTAV